MRNLAIVIFLAGGWLFVAPHVLGLRGTAAISDQILGAVVLLIAVSVLVWQAKPLPANDDAELGSPARSTDDLYEVVRTLAELPEEELQAALRDRLRLFAQMLEGQRKRAMRPMVEALVRLPDERLARLVSIRTRLLSRFPERQRRALMQTHVAVLNELSEADRQRELRFLTEAVARLPVEKRMQFEQIMQTM